MAKEPPDQFDALRIIVDQLKERASDEQKQIIRWACEKLGIEAPSATTNQNLNPIIPVPSVALHASTSNIKSFIEEKKPQSDNQFAAAVAYFYRFVAPEKKDAIGAEDLQEATRLAGWARLKQPAKTMSNAAAAGLMDNVGRGMYRVNTVGENLVALVLSGQSEVARPKTRKAISSKKKKKTAKRKK